MRNRFKIKIHAALLISLAFIFRLVFINISVTTTLSTYQTHKLVSKHFSTVQKKRRQTLAVTTPSDNLNYPAEEVYAERSPGGKNLIRAGLPLLLLFVFSFIKVKTGFPRSNASNSLKYYLNPRKHLALSGLRI